jgi:hypothetical protein
VRCSMRNRYGHLLPEADKPAAAELEAVRAATRLAWRSWARRWHRIRPQVGRS